MASTSGSSNLYPAVPQGHPDAGTAFLAAESSASASLYPSADEIHATARELFPETPTPAAAAVAPVEEPVLTLSGAILHLIDTEHSLDLGAGQFSILRIREGDHEIAVLARLVPDPRRARHGWSFLWGAGRDDSSPAEQVQWPLTRDVAVVKLDECRYFFSVHVPRTEHEDPSLAADDKADEAEGDAANEIVSYGLTVAGKGQEKKLKELDGLLDKYTSFSVQKVDVAADAPAKEKAEVLSPEAVKRTTPEEALGSKQEEVSQQSAAYWTTLAPNVENYNSMLARLVARGSGQVIRGILWTGHVTTGNLKKGEVVLKKKLKPGTKAPFGVSNRAIRRMKRARWITTMSEKVAIGILTGVVSVTGFFTSSVAKTKPAQKFFKLLPGEVILASLDGFGKICDAVEVAGKEVLQTTSVVATNVATHKFGEETGQLAHEYLHATGHALGAAWAVFKIRKALEPNAKLNSTSLVKSTAASVITQAVKGKVKI